MQVGYTITSPRRPLPAGRLEAKGFLFWFFFQVFLYSNILYTYIADITNQKDVLLNGAVDFLATISGELVRFRLSSEQKT